MSEVAVTPAWTAAPSGAGRPLRFVVSSLPTDSHMWNLVALQLLVEEMGHLVVNLGSCVPVRLLLDACRRERPDCVLISTVNGHGHVDGVRVITALRADPLLAGLTVVIGGQLSTGNINDDQLRADLRAAGFDAVFPVDAGGAARAIEQLREFVASRVRGAT